MNNEKHNSKLATESPQITKSEQSAKTAKTVEPTPQTPQTAKQTQTQTQIQTKSKYPLFLLSAALGLTSFLMVVFLITTVVFAYVLFKGNLTTIKTNVTRDTIQKLISEDYVGDKPDTKAATEGELKGLVGSLNDPYSQYLTQDESNSFRDSINEEYEGIGVRFSDMESKFVISDVVSDGPAARAGVQNDDVLSAVNGESVEGSTLADVTTKIKGPKGTSVDLSFVRGTETKVFSIQRDAIKSELVTLKTDGQFAIIRISSFGDGVATKLEAIAQQIKQNSDIKAIILDLRSNTGGILTEGIGGTSFFVDSGDVVTSEVGTTDKRVDKSKTVTTSLKDYPLAIVVDEYTASASEIMAAGIRDNRNGDVKIIGHKTYGKGVVQKLYPLPDGGTLKLTVAEWLTPKEEKINKKGINPDVEVDPAKAVDQAKEELNSKL